MNIVVTGSSGFIGNSAVKFAKLLGYNVIPFDYKDGLDILNPTQIGKYITSEIDVVIHLAGLLGTSELLDNLSNAIKVNMIGTKNILDATSAANAGFVGITMPDVWPSAYQATKIGAQKLANAYNNAYGVPVVHIKAFNAYGIGQAYGPGHPQKIVPTFATHSWNELPIPIWGDGEQTVDLVHVDDIGLRLVLAANQIKSGDLGNAEVYDAGSGVETTVIDVAKKVRNITKKRFIIEHLPMRKGELPNTKLCATNFGPWTADEIASMQMEFVKDPYTVSEDYRLSEAVNYYKP